MEIDREEEYPAPRDGDGEAKEREEGPDRPTLAKLWRRGEVVILDYDGEH